MKNIAFLLLIFICFCAKAQQTYSVNGIVSDEKGQPVAGAVVFITNTKNVTSTNKDGKFHLYDIPPGNYEVAIKMLGFNPFTQPITVNEKPFEITARLTESTTMLETVTIRGGPNTLRDGRIGLFTRNFIGKSDNAGQCKLVNPEVLQFHQTGGVLYAKADDFLIVENEALGYRLKYLLTDFEYHWGIGDIRRPHAFCIIGGSPYFEEMQDTEDQQKKWDENRRAAYLNSDRHFFRALANNTLKEEGFQVYAITNLTINNSGKINNKHYSAYTAIEKKIKHLDTLTIDTLTCLVTDNPPQKYRGYNVFETDKKKLRITIAPADTASITNEAAFPLSDASSLFFTGHTNYKTLTTAPKVIGGDTLRNNDAITLKDIYIVYTGDKEPPLFRKTGIPLILFPFIELTETQKDNRQISVIHPLADSVTIDNNGGITPAKGFEYSGYWAWKGIADLTPLDYFAQQGIDKK